jgi:hypothetical protein
MSLKDGSRWRRPPTGTAAKSSGIGRSRTNDDESYGRRPAVGNPDLTLRVAVDAASPGKARQANDLVAGRGVGRENADITLDRAAHARRLDGHGERHRFDTWTAARYADRHSAGLRQRLRSGLGAGRCAEEKRRGKAKVNTALHGFHGFDMIRDLPGTRSAARSRRLYDRSASIASIRVAWRAGR